MTVRAIEAAIDSRKRFYNVGDRIRIDRWAHSSAPALRDGEPSTPPGTEGTVEFIDDLGTLHTAWDTGAKLGATIDDSVTRLRCAA